MTGRLCPGERLITGVLGGNVGRFIERVERAVGAARRSDSGRSVDLAQRQAGGDASHPSYRRVVLLVFAGMLLGLGIACLVMSQSGFESRGSLEPRNTPYQGAQPVTGDPGR